MKLLLKILLSLLVIFIIVGGSGLFYLSRGLEAGASAEIENVNLAGVSDGTYIGKYDSGRWTNKVKVTVKDKKITGIEIVDDVTFPKPEWTAELLERILQKQSTGVDVISGATVTSKAYLKSIENALSEGIK